MKQPTQEDRTRRELLGLISDVRQSIRRAVAGALFRCPAPALRRLLDAAVAVDDADFWIQRGTRETDAAQIITAELGRIARAHGAKLPDVP